MKRRGLLYRITAFAAGLLPHFLAVYAMMLLVFYVINRFNPAMSFLDSEVSQHFELLLCAVSVLTAMCTFLRRRLRIASVAVTVVTAAFLSPVLTALQTGSRTILTNGFFEALALCCALGNLLFAVCVIAADRRTPKK